MSNVIIGAPKHTFDKVLPPIMGGGRYVTNLPVGNLGRGYYVEPARTVDTALASTKAYIDFKEIKQTGIIFIPDSNLSILSSIKFRGSSTPKWDTLTVSVAASVGTKTIFVTSYYDQYSGSAYGAATALGPFYITRLVPASLKQIEIGDLFTIGSSDTLYRATAVSDISVSTFSISFVLDSDQTSGLQTAAIVGDLVECRTGAFDKDTVFETDWLPVFPPESELGTGVWGSPELWDGRPTELSLARQFRKKQFYYRLPEVSNIRYLEMEIDDQSNQDGYISIAELGVCGAYTPPLNMDYGVKYGLRSATVREANPSGVAAFQKEATTRYCSFGITGMAVSEALNGFLKLFQLLDISEDFVFVYDDETYALDTYKLIFNAYFEETDNGFSQDSYEFTNTGTITAIERVA